MSKITAGKFLKKIRKGNGLSLREVARKSNLVHTYFEKVENGRAIRPDHFRQVANAYGLIEKQRIQYVKLLYDLT